ncbi:MULTISPECIES: transglutaminase domain-containing protein [unclassified Archaeoglobus]|jgi:predicted transglutaminase-like cysteine proteinase|uniref:transglutaminase domain-containing protein n=1 Tax=unclassified Archaeoglobus TaxID=2643606 RepID=UPI0025B8EDE9|nr:MULTISPECIES: transglutaminase domain-containing protein [unclassified Archaeoglobus]
MGKTTIVLIFGLLLFSTLSFYLYDELTKIEVKYEFLKREYLELSQEIELLNQKSVYIEGQLENSTKMLEDIRTKNEKLRKELKKLRALVSANPKRVEVELTGKDMDSRLEIIKNAIMEALNSEIVLAYSEMTNISDAVYINDKEFSFNYVSDQNLFGERDVLVNPEWFLVHRVGDCDDVAAAMAAILKAKGYNVKFCAGHREGDEDGSKHAWVRMDLGDVDYRYCVDMVCPLKVGDFGNIAEKCVDI